MHYYLLNELEREQARTDSSKIQLQTTLVDCSRLNLILDSLHVLHWNESRVYVSCNVNCMYVQADLTGVKHMSSIRSNSVYVETSLLNDSLLDSH